MDLTNKELQFILYSTPQEDVKVEAIVKDETICVSSYVDADGGM